ncbi:MAG TPA: PAS domain-containing sensor histidine kinase [Herpetosiphonaceae bacterium]|nr:PAS domain-containing sensor histidine kinase [Herpetosiphonaceae bacterium]
MPDHDVNIPTPVEARSMAPVEQWEVNEQLLLTGLRQMALTDQLERQLAFSSAIAVSLPEGVCALDQGDRITFINAAAERMLGWREAEVRGLAADAVLHGPDAESEREPFPSLDVSRSGMTSRNDHTLFRRKDGTTFPVAYSAAPIVVDEQVVGTVVAFDDQTEVQRLHQMQEDYLALLSHDLRTPLAAVIGHAQLLLRQLEQAALERARRSAEAIVTSSATMTRMLQDVLDGHQLQAGHGELQLAPIDLTELVTLSIDENMLPAERERIKVEAVELIPIVADAIRLERVIVNLLTNACKYSAPTDPVMVRVFRIGRDAMISVTDQGVGVDADDLAHLFDKHYRAKTAGTTQGLGLGLFGSRLIVEAHGGRIWAQSAVAAGSTFLVSLPAGEPSPSANEP